MGAVIPARRIAFVVWTAACALAPRAFAQSVPVVLVTVQGAPQDEGVPALNRVATAIGPEALTGATLAQQIGAHYGSRPVGGDPLARARARIDSSIARWTAQSVSGTDDQAIRAMEEVDAAARTIEDYPDALDQREENQRALRHALVWVAERVNAMGNAARLEDTMRRLVRADPAISFTEREASLAVQRAYASALAALPRGTLAVDSVPPGCTVYRDGRLAGAAPVELQDLAPGAHRVSVTCGAIASLVHPVEVAPRTRSTLIIDTQLDATLALQPVPSLRYATPTQADARLTNDLVALGRALGARRVFGVLARRDVVRVADVASAALLGDSPVTDGARLRLLVTESVVTPVHSSPAPEPVVVASAPPVASPAPVASAPVPAAHDVTPPPPQAAQAAHRRGGISPVAIVLGVVGVAALGVCGYAVYRADAEETHALQIGGGPNDIATQRNDLLNDASAFRWVEWGTLIGGGVLVVSGVLVGILARGETQPVQASVAPVAGGAVVSVGGRL
jgi:hypothetical protein